MSEEIINRLKGIANYSSTYPHTCVAASELEIIVGEIKSLNYGDFVRVLEYVRNSTLPGDFKEELEYENNFRGHTNKM